MMNFVHGITPVADRILPTLRRRDSAAFPIPLPSAGNETKTLAKSIQKMRKKTHYLIICGIAADRGRRVLKQKSGRRFVAANRILFASGERYALKFGVQNVL